MTPAEEKALEANGAGLKEVKSEVASDSSSEELPPFQKRSRRRECIFITIAVVLGAGLVAVLVYFSVTNALKEDDPEEARHSAIDFSTSPSTTPLDFDYQGGIDDGFSGDTQGGNPLTRNFESGSDSGAPQIQPRIGPQSRIGGEASSNFDSPQQDSRLRGLPRGMIPLQETTTSAPDTGDNGHLFRQARLMPRQQQPPDTEDDKAPVEDTEDVESDNTDQPLLRSNPESLLRMPQPRGPAAGGPPAEGDDTSSIGEDDIHEEKVEDIQEEGEEDIQEEEDVEDVEEDVEDVEEEPPTTTTQVVNPGIPENIDRSSLLRGLRRPPQNTDDSE